LIIDDDPDIIYALSCILEKSSYEVRCASSVDIALGIIEAWQPHIVLSDYQLGNKTGGDLIEAIRQQFPEQISTIKFVLLTGNAITTKEDPRCNGILVLEKPIRFSVLIEALLFLLSSEETPAY